MGTRLSESFYLRADVVRISRELLGCHLYSMIDGVLTGGRIIETEAYRGVEDGACHAYQGRRTVRTEVMYRAGGICYVYLCYGVHHLLNVVTHQEEVPHAVLIRALEPLVGVEIMQMRRKKEKVDTTLTSGPGSVTQALGIDRRVNGLSLQGESVWIEAGEPPLEIVARPRIGVAYAGEDAHLPWRFSAR